MYFTYEGGPVFQINRPSAPSRPPAADSAKPETGNN
jgi:hypothetical protein